MNQADRDAAKYMEAAARWREREIYRAKETGDAYHVNQYGDVIVENQQHEANCPAVDGFGCRCEEEACRYCGGNCPNDEAHACDGYLGDIDNLYGEVV